MRNYFLWPVQNGYVLVVVKTEMLDQVNSSSISSHFRASVLIKFQTIPPYAPADCVLDKHRKFRV
jgi:hypothetical protein